MSTFVRGDYHPTVLRQPLHPLLHPTVIMRTTVITSVSFLKTQSIQTKNDDDDDDDDNNNNHINHPYIHISK